MKALSFFGYVKAYLSFACIFLGIHSQVLRAQINPTPKVEIKFKDLNADYISYSGFVIEGNSKDSIYLLLENGNTIIRSKEDVISLDKKETKKNIDSTKKENGMEGLSLRDLRGKAKRRYRAMLRDAETYTHEGGYYAQLGLDFSTRPEFHSGFEVVFGYRFNQYLYLGGGLAFRSWTYDVEPAVVNHYFIDYRGYLEEKENSPYFRMRLGYSNPPTPTLSEFSNYSSAEGGLFVSPAMGLRLVEDRTFNLNLELGYQHTRLKYNIQRFNNPENERTYRFHRVYFQISMMFQSDKYK